MSPAMKLPPVHPAAETFPLMPPVELQALADDIRANGLHEPIIMHEGKILDGRNRWLACQLVEVKPRTQDWRATEASPWRYTWSANARRRHLDPDRQGALWLVHSDGDAEWQRKQEAARKRANKGRSEKAAGNKNASKNSGGAKAPPSFRYGDRHAGRQAEAAEAGVSTSRIARLKQLRVKDPERFAQVVAGETKASKALSEAKRAERVAQVVEKVKERIAAREAAGAPEALGIYPVIVADPPWRFESGTTDPTRQIENHYPTMELEAICDLAVENVTNEDAILFLWHPPGMATEAVRVAMAWGFRERSSWVWVKPSIGPGYWGRLRHENVMICTRGKFPTPAEADRFDSVFEAPRGSQSEKPPDVHVRCEAMFATMPKLELFGRRLREGWMVLGNEVGTGDIAASLARAGADHGPDLLTPAEAGALEREAAALANAPGLSIVCPVCGVGVDTPCFKPPNQVLEHAHPRRIADEAAAV